jgi:hypothetical protein
MWISDEPVVAISEDAPALELGTTILEALAKSREGLPSRDPRDETLDDAVMHAAGTSTWKEFVAGARMVLVEASERSIHLYSSRQPKRSEKGAGFLFLPMPLESEGAKPAAVGARAREALSRCEQ